MTFDPTTQILLNGTWTDVTTDVRQADGIQISRGRPDETSTVDPSHCTLTLDNRSGNYSPRNPVGAYYGNIGRNTPIRVLGPTSDPSYMALPGSATSTATTSRASTPDTASLDITGDIDIRVHVALDDWTRSGDLGGSQVLVSKSADTGDQRSWRFYVTTDGNLALLWSTTGSAINTSTSTVAPTVTDGEALWVRVTLDVNNGAGGRSTRFYTSPDGSAWTQLGSTVTVAATTSIFSSTADVWVGSHSGFNGVGASPMQGKVFSVEIRNGIAGTIVASPNFGAQDSGTTSFTDAQGLLWTLEGNAVMANPNARFHGEMSALPQRWDKTGRDVYAPVQAYGILRRIGQWEEAQRSTLYQALSKAAGVVQYWPCEDEDGATGLASALPGMPPLNQHGSSSNAAFDGFAASEPIPTLSDGHWVGEIPTYTNTDNIQVTFLLAVPTAGAATTSLFRVRTTGGGSVLVPTPRWDVDLTTAGQLRLRAYNDLDVQVGDSGNLAFDVNGRLLRVALQLQRDGSDIDWTLSTLEVGEASATAFSGTFSGRTMGRAVRVGVAVGTVTSSLDGVAIGQVAVMNTITATDEMIDELNAYAGEPATHRILRLCQGADFPVTIVGAVEDATRLGPQRPATVMELLAEAAAADLGVLYEPREFLGLAYRTRASLYAQPAALTLDYTDGGLSSIEPTEDDDAVRNDITVSRVGGSSARAQLEVGPLSVNPPPAGVGRYNDEIAVSIERDVELPDQAGWRLHMGTVDEARYPVLGMNLANSAFTSDAVLTAAAQALDVGDRLVVTGAPSATTSPDDIQQIAQGLTEKITPYEWLIDINCTPASPWDVALWDDTTGPGEARYSSDGTTITEDLTLTETGINVSTPTGPVWSSTAVPYDIVIGGERMTVTAVSGVSAAQVFTVTRSVNGVEKTHANGAKVALYKPAIYAM